MIHHTHTYDGNRQNAIDYIVQYQSLAMIDLHDEINDVVSADDHDVSKSMDEIIHRIHDARAMSHMLSLLRRVFVSDDSDDSDGYNDRQLLASDDGDLS